MKNKTVRKCGRPQKLTPELEDRFLERYGCSRSSIQSIAAELGISDRTIYRALRRDARFLQRYERASDNHLFVWFDHFDSSENYIGNMEQAWKDWRILSALIARAREGRPSSY